MRLRRFLPTVVLAAALMAATGASVAGAAPARSANAATRAATPTDVMKSLQDGFIQVVKLVTPQVVQIETDSGLGSGIVFDAKGHIVTNAHVVGSSKTFKVTFANGRQYTGSLVGSFPANDLAVIKIPFTGKPATFADSSKLQVGQIAMAVGNPLGLSSSVTQGIVSALGRTGQEGGGVSLPNLIQTSAPINPGNSGGALVDINGAVIGIPTLGAPDPNGGGAAPGIGFAIPSNDVSRIANQLIRYGKVVASGRAALGIRAATINGGGVIVSEVLPGSAAAKAGIKSGDVIVAVGGKPTPTVDDLSAALAAHKPGSKVKVELRSASGTQRTVTVTLGELAGA